MAGETETKADRELNQALNQIRFKAPALSRREAMLQLLRVGGAAAGAAVQSAMAAPGCRPRRRTARSRAARP